MLDIVTFETAKRLKEAGFPQPRHDFDQTWYVKRNDVLWSVGISGYVGEGFQAIFLPLECKFIAPDYESGDIIFATTATDILHQIPGADLKWNGSTFICKYRGKVDDTDPAECAAKMWFKIFAND